MIGVGRGCRLADTSTNEDLISIGKSQARPANTEANLLTELI
jgi:hypothetical protein